MQNVDIVNTLKRLLMDFITKRRRGDRKRGDAPLHEGLTLGTIKDVRTSESFAPISPPPAPRRSPFVVAFGHQPNKETFPFKQPPKKP